MADTRNTSTLIGSAPVRFTGTEEQRRANYSTHMWMSYDPDEREECDQCCAKSGSLTADWPCGECPRYEAHRLALRGFGLRVQWGEYGGMVMSHSKGTYTEAMRSREAWLAQGIPADQLSIVADITLIGWVDPADAWYYDGAVWEDRDGSGWLQARDGRLFS